MSVTITKNINKVVVTDAGITVQQTATTGLQNLVEDTTPQLGGDLDLNGNVITGLEIGTDVQAYSSKLASLSSLTPAMNFIVGDGLGGWETQNASAVRATLGLVIGTNVQAHSSVLDNTTASFTTADETKLDGIEAGADVTDETNVKSALDGATITSVTPTTSDLLLLQDASDSNNLKRATASDIVALGGGGGGGMTVITHTDVSGTPSTIDFTGIDGTYDFYKIEFSFVCSTDSRHLQMQVSTDNGSSWVSSTSYRYGMTQYNDTSTSVAFVKSSGTSLVSLANFVGNTSGENVRGEIHIARPSDTAVFTSMAHKVTYTDTASRSTTQEGSSYYTATTAVNGIRLMFSSSSTMASGSATLFGYNKE